MVDPIQQTQFFERILFKSTGQELRVSRIRFISGGCINNAIQLRTAEGDFFLKWNESKSADFFEVEAKGLALLKSSGAIRTPEVLGVGEVDGVSFLLLEYIEGGYPRAVFWERLGEQLADMHSNYGDAFGLPYNNFIGQLPQNNEPQKDGVTFFIEKRLRVQAGLALYNGLVKEEFLKQMDQFYEKLPSLLPKEKPSLLHGDLWSGNFLVGKNFTPVILDPAVYYGAREAELAFTKLFGGFDPIFYSAYEANHPLEQGYKERFDIYNLYPLLVHTNLFGTSYLSGVTNVLNKYL